MFCCQKGFPETPETPPLYALECPSLGIFNPDRPVKLSVDASSKFSGTILIQDHHPVAYALRSLTSTQHNYTQIEKERLAVVFGSTKFHDYIYGVPNITVKSEQKPLEAYYNTTVPSTLATSENDTDNTKITTKCSLQTLQGACPCRHVIQRLLTR